MTEIKTDHASKKQTHTVRFGCTKQHKEFVKASGGSEYMRNLVDMAIAENIAFESETTVKVVTGK